MLDEPTIGPELRARYMDTLDQQYEFDALFATIDEWVAENHDSALRDQQQWGQAYTQYGGWNWRSDFLDHEGELQYMRDWLLDRWDYLYSLY